jgi:O-methyltransferase involved in polyketide biosynthesis
MPGAAAGVALDGVPETMLWTLYQRAVEARRPDTVLRDPEAVRLVERIDYPFQERFGSSFGQWQALRARCFDDAIRRYCAIHPACQVVALGAGLETQLWRVDDGQVRWLNVDLPEAVALRERLLPAVPRQRDLACSVLDERWLDEVDPSRGVLVTAQGLLMYLERTDAYRVLETGAARLRRGALVFDAVPAWLSARSRAGGLKRPGYTPPPWPWGVEADERQRLAAIPHVLDVRVLRPPRGRGPVHGALLPLLGRVPPARRRLLSVFALRIG